MTIGRGGRNKAQADMEFLDRAFAARQRSDDPKASRVPSSGVGAVLVSGGRILSESANVIPPPLKARRGETTQLREAERYHFIEHAERAAIYSALLSGECLSGATLYCTRFPCSDCARALVWVGVKRVVTATGFSGEERWIESQRASLRILRDSGVKVRVAIRTPTHSSLAALRAPKALDLVLPVSKTP